MRLRDAPCLYASPDRSGGASEDGFDNGLSDEGFVIQQGEVGQFAEQTFSSVGKPLFGFKLLLCCLFRRECLLGFRFHRVLSIRKGMGRV